MLSTQVRIGPKIQYLYFGKKPIGDLDTFKLMLFFIGNGCSIYIKPFLFFIFNIIIKKNFIFIFFIFFFNSLYLISLIFLLFIFFFIFGNLCLRNFRPFNILLYFWLFLKLKLTFSFYTEFVSFINLIVGLRVCFVNISPSFNKLTITFVLMIFPQLPIHTHIFFPQKYPLTSECSSLWRGIPSCKAVSNKSTIRKATKVASETAAITSK